MVPRHYTPDRVRLEAVDKAECQVDSIAETEPVRTLQSVVVLRILALEELHLDTAWAIGILVGVEAGKRNSAAAVVVGGDRTVAESDFHGLMDRLYPDAPGQLEHRSRNSHKGSTCCQQQVVIEAGLHCNCQPAAADL